MSPFLRRCEGLAVNLCGLVKTQKHSASSSLHVIVGSKVIVPSRSDAVMLDSFLRGVSDRLSSWKVGSRGFDFGASRLSRFRASTAQSLG